MNWKRPSANWWRSMISRLRNLLPASARLHLGNPLLQYELAKAQGGAAGGNFALQLTALMLLLGVSAALYAAVFGLGNTGNLTGLLWQSLYFPALTLQTITFIIALALGAASVDAERSRKTWDKLRATEAGASLALRARWLGILYRLRAPIAVILLLRLLLALGILLELTAFGGHYAQMLSAEATPPLSDWRIGLLLIALSITLSLAQPLAMIASAAALGLFLSVTVVERVYGAVLQIALVALVAAIVTGASAGAADILQSRLIMSDAAQYLLVLAYSSYGDWGLLLAQLGSLGQVWGRVPAGVFISLGMAALLLLQALLADGLMSLAEGISERRG